MGSPLIPPTYHVYPIALICAGMKRLIDRALMPLSLASDLPSNPKANAPDTANINCMKVLLWNVEGAKSMFNSTSHDFSCFEVLAFTETLSITGFSTDDRLWINRNACKMTPAGRSVGLLRGSPMVSCGIMRQRSPPTV